MSKDPRKTTQLGNETVWRQVMGQHADSLRGFYGQLLALHQRAGDGEGGAGRATRIADRAAPYGESPPVAAATPVRDLEAALGFAERLGGSVERRGGPGEDGSVAVVRAPGGRSVALRAAGAGPGSGISIR